MSSHLHQLPAATFPVDRLDYVVDVCTGRRVLHIGCVDDTDVETKLAADRHLHERLAGAASVVGLDLNREGLAALHTRGQRDLVTGSAAVLPFRRQAFDVVVLGEILEHLADPAAVLRAIKASGVASEIVVTVPNAYSWVLNRELSRGHEVVNPDHVCTYTPTTLTLLLARAGWTVDRMQPYAWSQPLAPLDAVTGAARRLVGRGSAPVRPGAILRNARMWRAYQRQPFTGDGLIAITR